MVQQLLVALERCEGIDGGVALLGVVGVVGLEGMLGVGFGGAK